MDMSPEIRVGQLGFAAVKNGFEVAVIPSEMAISNKWTPLI